MRLATADECIRVFGHAPGTVPPVGHRQVIKPSSDETDGDGARASSHQAIDVIVDSACVNAPSLLGGGGEEGTLLCVPTAALIALDFVTRADVAVQDTAQIAADLAAAETSANISANISQERLSAESRSAVLDAQLEQASARILSSCVMRVCIAWRIEFL